MVLIWRPLMALLVLARFTAVLELTLTPSAGAVTSGATIDQGAGNDSVYFGSSLTGTTLTGNGADTFSMQGATTVVFGAPATAASLVTFGSNADMATFSGAVGQSSIYGGAELTL